MIHCQRYISTQDETLDIKCLNSPLSAGRYLVLGFDKIAKSLLHTRQLLNGEWKLTFIHKAGLKNYIMFFSDRIIKALAKIICKCQGGQSPGLPD